MPNSARTSRKAGDKTRKKILNAAKVLFTKQGFAATSMQAIALKASVTKALIYHHFACKETLWIDVKLALLSHYNPAEITLPDPKAGLAAFLAVILDYKFTAFQNKHLVRMLIWQNLESDALKAKLYIPSKLSPTCWLTHLRALKAQKQLKDEISAEVAMVLISSALSGPFLSSCLNFIDDKSLQAAYKKQIITMLTDALSPKGKQTK